MKQVYLDIRAKVESDLTQVKWCRIWNNQLLYLEEQTQIPFSFPALFVEFVNVEYQELGQAKQNAVCTVRFHICDEFVNGVDQEENLQVFDLKTDIYKVFQNWIGSTTSPFTRTYETQDTSHTDVYHFIQDYEVRFVDNSAAFPVNGVEAEIDTLVLEKELVITNDIIKTAPKFNG